MKLNKELLLKLIKESMHKSIGPDDPTERGPKIQTMDKEAFLEKEWRNLLKQVN